MHLVNAALGFSLLLSFASVCSAEDRAATVRKAPAAPLLARTSYSPPARAASRAAAPAAKRTTPPKTATPLYREDVTLEEMHRYHQ